MVNGEGRAGLIYLGHFEPIDVESELVRALAQERVLSALDQRETLHLLRASLVLH